MNLALAVLAFLVNLATPGALPQGFIFSGTAAPVVVQGLCGSAGASTCTVAHNVSIGNGIYAVTLLEGIATVTYSDSGSNTYSGSLQQSSTPLSLGIDTNFSVATTGLTGSSSTVTSSNNTLYVASFSPIKASGAADVACTASSTCLTQSSGATATLSTDSNTTANDICFAAAGTVYSGSNPWSLDASSTGWTVIEANLSNSDNRWITVAWKAFTPSNAVSVEFDNLASGNAAQGVIRCFKEM